MSIGNLFKLSKLTILAYKDEERSQANGPGRFEVQYNPETLTLKHESVFLHGTRLRKAHYSHTRAKSLTVDLVFDGTRVGYMGVELLKHRATVGERVKDFLQSCYQIDSATHETAHLTLSWDKGVFGSSFDCRLQRVEIKYTAFERDGSPLHAELKAVFIESISADKQHAAERLTSPDVSHSRLVVAGDTLPLLCREIYGSASHYLRVAEVNGLDDFRVLTPGTALIFPPFERPAGH